MQTFLTYKFLEADSTWGTVNDKTVNPISVDSIVPYNMAGAMEVSVVSSQPFGGALVYRHIPFNPLIASLPYIGVDWQFMLPLSAVQFQRCLELDLKICPFAAPTNQTVRNVIDLSSQFEWYNGGMFQIDNAQGTWANTPFSVGMATPNVWNSVSYRAWSDYKTAFSFLSMAFNGGPANLIPAAMQKLPLLNSDWGTVTALQLQQDNNDKPASFSTSYRNIVITFSDQPF